MKYRYAAALALLAAACGGSSGPAPTPVTNPPQIACPADITVKGVNAASQPVTFDSPSVSGGTAPVNVSCAHASGSSFPLGTTSVSCTANDATGHQAACAFNVTLTGVTLGITKFDAVGDSLTAGENGRPAFIDTPNAYPTKLQAALDAAFPGQGTSVINRGTPGERVEVTVDRIRGFIAADRPGAVLLLTGYNNLDVCGQGRAATTPCQSAIKDVAFGVRDCIRHAKESSIEGRFVYVSTLTPPGPVLPGAPRDRHIDGDAVLQANSRIRQAVASEGGTLVDSYPLFVGHEADYVDTDGLHLRPAGYQALADAFFEAIRTTVPQTPLAIGRR